MVNAYLVLDIVICLTFLILNIVFLAKKKKSLIFSILSLSFNIVIFYTSANNLIFYCFNSTDIYLYVENYLPFLIFSFANIVLTCFVVPNTKSNTSNEKNGIVKNSTNITTEETENGVSENYTLTTDEECKNAYKTSTRRKLDIWMIVCWSITGVFGLGAIILCILNTTAGCIILFFAIGSFLASLSLTNARKVYCSCCGSEGVVDESELLSTKTTVQVKETNVKKLSDDSYEYQTELKPTTTNIHRHELHCPCCGNKWSAIMRSSRSSWK